MKNPLALEKFRIEHANDFPTKLLERITMENLENYFLNFVKNHAFISSKMVATYFVRDMLNFGKKESIRPIRRNLIPIASRYIQKMMKKLENKSDENLFIKFSTKTYRINPSISLNTNKNSRKFIK